MKISTVSLSLSLTPLLSKSQNNFLDPRKNCRVDVIFSQIFFRTHISQHSTHHNPPLLVVQRDREIENETERTYRTNLNSLSLFLYSRNKQHDTHVYKRTRTFRWISELFTGVVEGAEQSRFRKLCLFVSLRHFSKIIRKRCYDNS